MSENILKKNMHKNLTKNMNVKEIGLLVFMIIAMIYIQMKNPQFLTGTNITDLLKNTSLLGMLSVGMMLVMLTGGIDLSIGAVLALSGMSAARFVSIYPDLPVFFSLLLGMMIGIVTGLILGLLVSKGRINPTIASLGMMNVHRGLTYVVGNNAWISAHQMTPAFKSLSTGSFFGLNNLILFSITTFAIFYYFLQYAKTGRNIYAVGSNYEATSITGIATNRTIVTAYVLNGLIAGLAGVLWVSKYASAQGDTGVGYEMSVIAACVLGGVSVRGGVGKISSLILGVLMLGILNNALPLLNISTFWEDFITGFIILVAILLNLYIQKRQKKDALKRRAI